jgi:hypothetical protein
MKIYDVENGAVVSSQVLSTNGSGHGALAGFLRAQKVEVLICGGIGGGAQMALAEAGIKLYGGCKADNFTGCHMSMAVFQGPSRVVQAFLSVSLVIVIIMTCLIRYWRTGIDETGRSIGSIASLLGATETREVFQKLRPDSDGGIGNNDMIRKLNGNLFRLAQSPGSSALGISTSRTLHHQNRQAAEPMPDMKGRRTFPLFKVLSLSQSGDTISQVGFLLSICGFLILIVYYESTSLDTPFERFMDSQNFGVRVLFTALGVVISLFWDDYFSRKLLFHL